MSQKRRRETPSALSEARGQPLSQECRKARRKGALGSLGARRAAADLRARAFEELHRAHTLGDQPPCLPDGSSAFEALPESIFKDIVDWTMELGRHMRLYRATCHNAITLLVCTLKQVSAPPHQPRKPNVLAICSSALHEPSSQTPLGTANRFGLHGLACACLHIACKMLVRAGHAHATQSLRHTQPPAAPQELYPPPVTDYCEVMPAPSVVQLASDSAQAAVPAASSPVAAGAAGTASTPSSRGSFASSQGADVHIEPVSAVAAAPPVPDRVVLGFTGRDCTGLFAAEAHVISALDWKIHPHSLFEYVSVLLHAAHWLHEAEGGPSLSRAALDSLQLEAYTLVDILSLQRATHRLRTVDVACALVCSLQVPGCAAVRAAVLDQGGIADPDAWHAACTLVEACRAAAPPVESHCLVELATQEFPQSEYIWLQSHCAQSRLVGAKAECK